jgi:hypothetical protein
LLAASALLGTALLHGPIQAQPNPDPALARESNYSLEELERFINGRSLVTVDLKDASLSEIAAALNASTGIKFSSRMPSSRPSRIISVGGSSFTTGGNGAPQAPEKTFSVSASKQPFWEAMRKWHLMSVRENATIRDAAHAKAVADKVPFFPPDTPPKSFNVLVIGDEFQLMAGEDLGSGRAVAEWPLLLVGHSLHRGQRAELTEEGLSEPPVVSLLMQTGQFRTGTIKLPPAENTPPLPEEKRWVDTLEMNIYTYIDPKVKPSRLRCEVLEAIDDEGNDLLFPSSRYQSSENSRPAGGVSARVNEFNTGAQGNIPLQVTLASKPKMGKKLVKLRGVVRFNVLTRTQHWETTDFEKPIDDTLKLEGGDFKIGFTGLHKEGNMWAGGFEGSSRGRHLQRFWNDRFANRNLGSQGSGVLDFDGLAPMRLVDAKGTTLVGMMSAASRGLTRLGPPRLGAPPAPQSPDLSPVPPDVTEDWEYHEGISFDFRSPSNPYGPPLILGEGVKLIVDLPVERREVVVPFEFTNLPLPPS